MSDTNQRIENVEVSWQHLKKNMLSSFDDMQRLSSEIDEKLKVLSEQEERFNLSKQKILENIANAAEKIKLCVGGTMFMTTKTNLLKFEGSYFHALLGSGKWLPDVDGAYFIDLNPEHFGRILDYLRTNKLHVSDLDTYELERLYEIFDYLQFPYPEPRFAWKGTNLNENLTLSNGDKTVRQTKGINSGAGWTACILGERAINRYSVRIDSISGGFMMVGFVPASLRNYKATGANCTSCGWYLYLAKGVLYSQDGDNRRAYSTVQFEEGCTLSVIYSEAEGGSIRYEKDRMDLGIAFRNVGDLPLIPAVDFSCVGAQLTLV